MDGKLLFSINLSNFWPKNNWKLIKTFLKLNFVKKKKIIVKPLNFLQVQNLSILHLSWKICINLKEMY